VIMELFAERQIDYVRATIKNYTPEEIISMLPFEFSYRDWGRWTYRQSYVSLGGEVSIFFDGVHTDQGICLDIPGSGLRALEAAALAKGEKFDIREWLGKLARMGARASRIDVACDTSNPLVTMALVRHHLEQDAYVSRAQSWRPMECHRRGQVVEVQGFEIGGRKSESYMRIYDKALEQKVEGHLIRFEGEFKGKKAARLMEIFVKEGWDAAVGCLRSIIDFTEVSDEDENVSRRDRASWWELLIGASKHVVDVAKTTSNNLSKTYAWIERQCKGAFWALTEASGGSVDWFYSLLRDGTAKHSDKMSMMAQAAKLFLFDNQFRYQGALEVPTACIT